eukprot:s162_g12.t1
MKDGCRPYQGLSDRIQEFSSRHRPHGELTSKVRCQGRGERDAAFSHCTQEFGKSPPNLSLSHCPTCVLQVVHFALVSSPPRVAMPLKIAALPLIFLVGAIADVDDMMEDADLLAAVEAEDCFSEDCESADGLALAQLRASYLKAEAEAAPKYQYYGADELDFDAAIQEDSDAGIAFVQTSAKMVTSRKSSTLVVSADGSVLSGTEPTGQPVSGTSFAVSADGLVTSHRPCDPLEGHSALSRAASPLSSFFRTSCACGLDVVPDNPAAVQQGRACGGSHWHLCSIEAEGGPPATGIKRNV